MSEFYEGKEIDESCADSLQLNYAETTEADELQEEFTDNPESESELSKKDCEISELEHQYEQAKLSIEMSRTKEEEDYWIKRSDELWDEKDNAVAEYWQLKGQQTTN